tara:strand:+ start:31 stop:507 length:477 start_codon:yes stop_codon:yes gene_type:complete
MKHKNLLSLTLILFVFGCTKNYINSIDTGLTKTDLYLDGKFLITQKDKKESGYFRIEEKNDSFKLSLGKNYLLPEKSFTFVNESKINLNGIFSDITFDRFYLISPRETKNIFLGESNKETMQKYNVNYLDFDQNSELPTKISIELGEVRITFVINNQR